MSTMRTVSVVICEVWLLLSLPFYFDLSWGCFMNVYSSLRLGAGEENAPENSGLI